MINEKQAKKYCRDDISKIENYAKACVDKTQTWDLHHRLELTLAGEFALTAAQLKMHDMYYNRPYYELIFLTSEEHTGMHNKGRIPWNKGKHHSDETRKKMSEAKKGKLKGIKLTDDHRRKISEAKKGKHLSDETRKKMSEAMKGKHHSYETRRKISEAAKRRLDSNEL